MSDSAAPTPPNPSPEPPAPPATPPPLTVVDRVKLVRDVFYVVALFGAGAWAIGTFYYHSVYLPSHEQPVVTSSMTLTVLGEKDGKALVNAHLVMKNESNVVRNTWAISFYAHGNKVTAGPLPDGGWRTREETPNFYDSARDFREEDGVLIASTVDLMTKEGRHNPVQPHAEMHRDFNFYVDRATADAVEVYVDVLWPVRAIAPKAEWFKLEHGKDPSVVTIVVTDACKASSDCDHFHSQFTKKMSLWPAPAPDQRPATSNTIR